jgi:hypothetical protein
MSQKVIVTQEILDANPDLVEQGVKIGEEIELGELTTEDGSALTGEAESFPTEEPKTAGESGIVGGREKDDR